MDAPLYSALEGCVSAPRLVEAGADRTSPTGRITVRMAASYPYDFAASLIILERTPTSGISGTTPLYARA